MGTCKNCLGEAVLTSTHNLCFGAKIRKIGIPLSTSVLLYKSGVQGGIYIARTCFPDALFQVGMFLVVRFQVMFGSVSLISHKNRIMHVTCRHHATMTVL